MTTKLIDVELRATGAKSAAKSLAKEVKGIGSSADKSSAGVSNLEGEISSLNKENAKLTKSLSDSRKALTSAERESEKLTKAQKKAEEQSKKLKDSEINKAQALAIAMNAARDLAVQTANTEKQQAALNKRNETAAARVAKLVSEHEDLINKSREASERAKEMAGQQDDLAKKIKKSTEEVKKNENSLDSSNKEVDLASKKLNKLKARNQAASSAIAKTTKVVRTLSKSAVAVAAAIAAATAATVAMVKSSADANRELETMAKLVGITTTEFNALAFATAQYGVSADQISDISKDVGEKVAEFAAAGTGAFQDYADVMKLSAKEAQLAALEFEKLSGDQVLKEVVRNLEAAGVSGGRVSFVLESLGNGATKLIPLLTKNSAELERLTSGFNSLNNQLSISAAESGDLKKVSETFDLLSGTATQARIAISSRLAPAISKTFTDITNLIPPATKALIEFINSFKDVDDIRSVVELEKELARVEDSLERTTKRVEKFGALFGTADIDNANKRIKELREQIKKLQSVSKGTIFEGSGFANTDVAGEVDEARAGAAGSEAPELATNVKEDAAKKAAADAAARAAEALNALKANLALETQALQNENAIRAGIREGAINAEIGEEVLRFSNKTASDTARFEAEIAKLTEDEAVKKELRLAFQEQQLEEARIFEGTLTAIAAEESDNRIKKLKEEEAERQRNSNSLLTTGVNLGAALLKNQISSNAKSEKEKKRARKKSVIIDTAAGISLAFATNDYISAIPIAASIAATGLANLATINSASSSGASTPTASSSAPQSISTPTAQAQQVQQTARVIDLRTDGSAFSLAVAEGISSAISDENTIVQITEGQAEAARLGVI